MSPTANVIRSLPQRPRNLFFQLAGSLASEHEYPRHSSWKADALPAELLPHELVKKTPGAALCTTPPFTVKADVATAPPLQH
jgi:hypothetical protein